MKSNKLFYSRIEPADYRLLKEGNVVKFNEDGQLSDAVVLGVQYGINSEAGMKVSVGESSSTRVLWKQPLWLEQKSKGLTLEQVYVQALQCQLSLHKQEIDMLKSRTAKLLEAVKLLRH